MNLQSVSSIIAQLPSDAAIYSHQRTSSEGQPQTDVREVLDPARIHDEDILAEMVDRYRLVKMPPKSRRKVVIEVRSKRRGKPSRVNSDDFGWS